MIIKNEINDPIIREAIKRVLAILETDRFYQEISEADFFGLKSLLPDHYGNQLSIWIAEDLKHSFSLDFEVVIKPIKTINPWSKMIASTMNGAIYINVRKYLEINERAGNIAHEISHLVSGYSHDGNYATSFNLKSPPYIIGQVVERLSKEIYGN